MVREGWMCEKGSGVDSWKSKNYKRHDRARIKKRIIIEKRDAIAGNRTRA